jgi:hypothetical protein
MVVGGAADRHRLMHLMCRLFRLSAAGSRFCCWSGTPDGRLDEVKKEIRDLKEEIGKMKESER